MEGSSLTSTSHLIIIISLRFGVGGGGGDMNYFIKIQHCQSVRNSIVSRSSITHINTTREQRRSTQDSFISIPCLSDAEKINQIFAYRRLLDEQPTTTPRREKSFIFINFYRF